MALYVDADYTVDDFDYFLDENTLYVECDYWITSPDYYAEGDGLCSVVSVSGLFIDWRRRRRMRRLNIRNP